MSLTEFGKEVRKLRIDRDLILKDMADALGVSPAFLSAVETGKKNVPNGFIARLAAAYSLDINTVHRLDEALLKSKSSFQIQVPAHASMAHREVAAQLARTFGGMDKAKAAQILALLKEEKDE
ncbi:helix-turn-helix domain-containing protein [Inquilinus limosus]|uniref:HTH cro/C1-type domain-containing protein n=1 Tax=Inquilinus limosus MP06 TaxID=1398085 RepID=A0A0A0D7V3_9PROT|nr:helix-turn-helix transcriptional regulator [Inquilinus limosus]KGM34766.1 hypothetical protein P409_08355 [Inquilinus limosus MP06]